MYEPDTYIQTSGNNTIEYLELIGDSVMFSFPDLYSNKLIGIHPQLLLQGVNQVLSSEFRIFPMPAKDFINIESNQPINNVKILNCLGQVVVSVQINETNNIKVNLASLKKGLYLIQLQVKDNQYITLEMIKD